ncbi:hypothetical protein AWB78_06908 [Caballeronia calidae]|uniref:Uncharacterized protein n=1 Tax=Caballeronia calidae TaxID=1777139 RepID=A0A158EBS0_9BURK|nr:hypothetical protein [Caballeronia calidae]SAL04329.1 hypothetical protein AWB78_06908 [Caballeronia calidae]
MWPEFAEPPKTTVGPEAVLEAFVSVELQIPDVKSHLLGDTGLSLPVSQRPRKLERWMMAPKLPEELRRLSRAHAGLSDLEGLLRVRLSRPEPEDSVWILARATDSLVTILVRKAVDETATQFTSHVSFLATQARRYCCAAALLLLDERDGVDEFGVFRAFALEHGEAAPVANKLYKLADTRPQLFYAYLR